MCALQFDASTHEHEGIDTGRLLGHLHTDAPAPHSVQRGSMNVNAEWVRLYKDSVMLVNFTCAALLGGSQKAHTVWVQS